MHHRAVDPRGHARQWPRRWRRQPRSGARPATTSRCSPPSWLAPSPPTRSSASSPATPRSGAQRMRDGWTGILRFASAGLTQTWTTDDLAGAAIWIPPGRGPSSAVDQLRLVPVYGRLIGWLRLRQTGSAIDALDERRRVHAPGSHYYLSALGVDPDRQGEGIGSALLASRPGGGRCPGSPVLPGDRHRAQRPALRAPRLRGRRGARAAGDRRPRLAHAPCGQRGSSGGSTGNAFQSERIGLNTSITTPRPGRRWRCAARRPGCATSRPARAAAPRRRRGSASHR